jgi:beta-RFAP synthase
MVELPGVQVLVERSPGPRADGPLGARALEAAGRIAEMPLALAVESAPRAHTGLGTGTQLALAAARGAAVLSGRDIPAPELAARVRRGARSAIGIHGFDRGGFIVDGGKKAGAADPAVAPLVARIEFPSAWRIVLATPTGPAGLSGSAEEDAFRKLDADRGRAAELCRIVQLGMAPALAEEDLDAFSTALADYGDLAGALFQRVQGGIFASPLVASMVEFARSLGARGSGQTSWGPTVYAVCGGEAAAREIAGAIEKRFGPGVDALVTGALNAGARVETWSDMPSLHTLA